MEETYICFLRGINVGGKKPLKMVELRNSLEKTEFKNVKTYIQSGNIIINSNLTLNEVKNKVFNIIKEDFGYELPIVITTANKLNTINKNNPLLSINITELNKQFIVLTNDLIDTKLANLLDTNKYDDNFKINNNHIYLYCPNGAGKTKITNNFLEKKLKISATTRNIKTINKIIELAKL